MAPSSPRKWLTGALVAAALIALLPLMRSGWRRSDGTSRGETFSRGSVERASPPSARPLRETAGLAPSSPETPEDYVPGHFPGVEVRTDAGSHAPTPPPGTRTPPAESVVELPDGRRLRAATVDETWRVPLKARAVRSSDSPEPP